MKNQSLKPYNFEDNVKLNNFVLSMDYLEKLSKTAQQIYLFALPELERRKSGFCQPTTATYREIAESTRITIQSIRDALDELNRILCDVKFGLPLKSAKKATCFRRYSIQELKNGTSFETLMNARPPSALELEKNLKDRQFIYGDATVKPFWSVGKTGRLYSSNPHVQGDSKDKRKQSIIRGLQPGEVVFDIDYKQAEPTVVQHAADFYLYFDPYDLLKDIMHITRDKAKIELNRLNYSPIDPVKKNQQWSPVDQAKFLQYAEAIHKLREKLWTDGAPCKGKPRFVELLSGYIIEAERGKQTHRGQILSWFAQGAISEILNSVCLEIIKAEPHKGWRFLFPMHDAAYIIGKPEHESELKEIFLRMPQKFGLNLDVDVKIYQ